MKFKIVRKSKISFRDYPLNDIAIEKSDSQKCFIEIDDSSIGIISFLEVLNEIFYDAYNLYTDIYQLRGYAGFAIDYNNQIITILDNEKV